MPGTKQILETIINDFSVDKFSRFFREKSRNFVARAENYSHYNDDDFKNGTKLVIKENKLTGEQTQGLVKTVKGQPRLTIGESYNTIKVAPPKPTSPKKDPLETAISEAEQLIKTLEDTKLIETKGKNIKLLRDNLEKFQKTIENFLKTLKK